MKKVFAIAAAALLVVGFTIDAASAKHRRHHGKPSYTGGNAALSGNNGNSGSGSNALGGNIKGGNIGAGK